MMNDNLARRTLPRPDDGPSSWRSAPQPQTRAASPPAPLGCVSAEVAATVSALPALVSLEDTAAFFRVTSRTIRRWVRTGRLSVSRTAPGGSGRVLIAKVEIARLLATMNESTPYEQR